ncbi:MAG TPA: stalk domain-containing protein [Candidatus Tumulicola sp.]
MTYRAPNVRVILATAAVALAASAFLAFARPAEMLVDGERVESDVPPVVTAGDGVFVPLRTIADALGAQTLVAERGEGIDVVRGHRSLRVRVGTEHATLDGMSLTLKHAPFRVRGRVMIELNAVANAFDVHASYDPRTSRVDVLTPGIGRATATSGAGLQTQ